MDVVNQYGGVAFTLEIQGASLFRLLPLFFSCLHFSAFFAPTIQNLYAFLQLHPLPSPRFYAIISRGVQGADFCVPMFT